MMNAANSEKEHFSESGSQSGRSAEVDWLHLSLSELVDHARDLRQENERLQRLVCHLLIKNERLRSELHESKR
jgi:hypothetical protein